MQTVLLGSLFPALEVDCDWVLPDAGIIKKTYTVICPSHCMDVNHCVRVKVNNRELELAIDNIEL